MNCFHRLFHRRILMFVYYCIVLYCRVSFQWTFSSSLINLPVLQMLSNVILLPRHKLMFDRLIRTPEQHLIDLLYAYFLTDNRSPVTTKTSHRCVTNTLYQTFLSVMCLFWEQHSLSLVIFINKRMNLNVKNFDLKYLHCPHRLLLTRGTQLIDMDKHVMVMSSNVLPNSLMTSTVEGVWHHRVQSRLVQVCHVIWWRHSLQAHTLNTSHVLNFAAVRKPWLHRFNQK